MDSARPTASTATAGATTRSAARRVRRAWMVINSGSPGPTPTPINVPIPSSVGRLRFATAGVWLRPVRHGGGPDSQLRDSPGLAPDSLRSSAADTSAGYESGGQCGVGRQVDVEVRRQR